MTPELRSGLLAGVLLATALGVVLVLTTSGTQRQFGAQPRPVQRNGHRDETLRTPVPIGGLAVVVGTLVTLVGRQPVPGGLLVAIAGVGIICAFDPRRLGVPASVALALPLAWLMAGDLDLDSDGMRVFVVLATALGAVAVARTEETWGSSAITPALLAITAGGDLPRRARYGGGGSAARRRARDGRTRLAARTGDARSRRRRCASRCSSCGARPRAGAPRRRRSSPGSRCVGLLAGLGIGRWLADVDVDLANLAGNARELRSRVAVIVLHGGLVLFVARVGGAGAGMGAAVVVTVATLVAAVLAGVVLRPPPP